MTKKETIELLQKQLPGFYSAEQVIKLISDIEESDKFELSNAYLNDLSSDIAQALSSEGTSIIDDYELSMSYKEVELDSIDFSTSDINRIVRDVVKDFMEQFKNEG
jgi:hypothetical protein